MTNPPKTPNPLSVLADDPQGRSLGLELPPGTLIGRPGGRAWLRGNARREPLLWVSDAPVGAGALAACRGPALAAGLQAVLFQERRGLESWWTRDELSPASMSDPDDHHVEPVLRAFWARVVPDPEEGDGPDGAGLIAPFGRDWPGLAEHRTPQGGPDEDDPEAVALALADELIRDGVLPGPRLALIPAGRGADVPTAMGWRGPTNYESDMALISTVLRSWEDRFGARVLALGFDELHLSVAAPPLTTAAALPVAAEHFAFCPDNVWQGSGSVGAYTDEAVTGSASWGFWWD
ncbi:MULTISPECIES: DUF4253 domain-containing protein [unclassified Streptomyces]|uniref:DUF4253 domain-containing protein n=1 Tax=unclassified Streptomyces TaxID=2593676 RepID=UPI00225533FF|nr:MULTISPECIES: DUF4253 domain-containing protein [unclassified Streptomyces]MCX4525963.1 DUF4253 domain-containing protein [Streptomyces sp. NBC_01551]MCX4543474.1 DUF4253 domain-containing protein [Streptomyces sp. NBC_01565]